MLQMHREQTHNDERALSHPDQFANVQFDVSSSLIAPLRGKGGTHDRRNGDVMAGRGVSSFGGGGRTKRAITVGGDTRTECRSELIPRCSDNGDLCGV